MIDKQILYAKVKEIEESLSRLRELRALTKESFLQDRDIQDIACYRVLILIEASISICQHICARELHQAPDSYAGCFSILGENEVIPNELADRLMRMARFRNMLVHIYWEIDNSLVIEIIRDRLTDIEKFTALIVKRYL